jgi:hypothetical protein
MITKHAKKRIKGRVGVRNADYNFKLAKKNGFLNTQFDGDYRRFLDYLAYRNKGKIIVYNEHIYIMKGQHLITVLNTPYKYKGIKPKGSEQK